MSEMTLRDFIDSLWADPVHPCPVNETWNETNARIRSGGNQQIPSDVYCHFRAILPPWFQSGTFFAYCAGREPLKLFDRKGDVCVCRLLTWQQTVTFCTLADIRLPE